MLTLDQVALGQRRFGHQTQASDWLVEPNRFHGEWRGNSSGARISVIANRLDGVGGGPRLHKHPYAEILIIRAGTRTITIGDRQITATAGQILVVPANAPHKFSNLGPGAFESIDIHESGEFITDWLE